MKDMNTPRPGEDLCVLRVPLQQDVGFLDC